MIYNLNNTNLYNESTRIKDSSKLCDKNMYMIEITTSEGIIHKDLCRFVKDKIIYNSTLYYYIYFDIEYYLHSTNHDDLKSTNNDDTQKKIQKQVHECNFEHHLILGDIRAKIYNYCLDEELQKQIKVFWQKKYLLHISEKNKCCSDMSNNVLSYLW